MGWFVDLVSASLTDFFVAGRSGCSPQNLTLEYVRERGLSGISIPPSDINAVTVPGTTFLCLSVDHKMTLIGATAAWVDTVERFGSGKVSIANVLEPAIRLAEEGFVSFCF